MKAISLHGPWAYYEKANAEKESRIQQLLGEVSYWKALAAEAREALVNEEQRRKNLEDCQIPALKNESGNAASIIDSLQAQLDQAHEELQTVKEEAAQSAAISAQNIESLLADNLLLKDELKKHLHVRSNLSSKVEDARKRLSGLGLTSQEAEVFIKDLDETKAANRALSAEVAALSADKAHLQQQCASRSAHAMTLISENKRLLEQVNDLRRQVTNLDQDTWRLKQDLAAAQKLGAKAQKVKEAAITARQERPEWQDRVPRRATSASVAGASRQPGADLTNKLGSGHNGAVGKGVAVSKPVTGVSSSRGGSTGGLGARAGALSKVASGGSGGASTDQARLAALYQSLSDQNMEPAGASSQKLPPGTGVLVQATSDRLEELRTAALHQACATRQQRLAQAFGPV